MKAIRCAGYNTVAEFCRTAGAQQNAVGRLLGLKTTPLTKNGEWTTTAIKICECLNKMPADLFPSQHLRTPLLKNSAEFECSIDDIHQISNQNPLDLLMLDDIKMRLLKKVNALPEREAVLIKRYFGFSSDGKQTLEQAGEPFKLSRERVRQIIARGLRKLKKYDEFKMMLSDFNEVKRING